METNTKRGRPSKTIKWPTIENFTVQDILLINEVSPVTVQKRVSLALKNNQLVKVDNSGPTSGRGRKANTYRLTMP